MKITIIGECPQCTGYFIEPPFYDPKTNEPKKCPVCELIVFPLKPLVRHEFPEGSRIDMHGRVWGPDNLILYEGKRKHTESPDSTVARIRKLLDGYDEGWLTEGEVGASLFRDTVNQIVAASESEWGVCAFSSYCGREPPPPVHHLVEIEIGAAHVIARKPRPPQPPSK